MQGAGHQAFAGARLTGEEHGWYLVQRGDLARPLEHRADGRRVAQHSLEPDVPGGAPAVVGQLLLQQAVFARPVGQQPQLLQIDRFLDVVERAKLHGLHRPLDRAVGRQHDHRDYRIELADPLEEIEPAHAGEPNVREDDIGLEALDQLERLLPGAHHLRLRPVPSGRVVKKGSPRFGKISAGIPGPESVISSTTPFAPPAAPWALAAISSRPPSGERMASSALDTISVSACSKRIGSTRISGSAAGQLVTSSTPRWRSSSEKPASAPSTSDCTLSRSGWNGVGRENAKRRSEEHTSELQ